MSIVVACLTDSRAAFITDTVAYEGRAPSGLLKSKAATNGRLACATRGRCSVADDHQKIIETTELDFDDLGSYFAGMCSPAINWPAEELQQLFIFGYSATVGRIVGTFFEWRGPSVTVTALAAGIHVFPPLVGNPQLPAACTDAQLFKLAMSLWKVPQQNSVGYCIGGLGHLTEVDAQGARTRIFGLFPDYDDLIDGFTDPNAEAVKAWRAQEATP